MKISTIFASLIIVFSPTLLFAQNDEGKSEVRRSLLEEAQRRSSVEQSPKAVETIPVSPYQIQEQTIDEVGTQLEGVEQKNAALIAEFQNLLSKSSTNPKAPEWLFRIAELEWQSAHYRYLRERRIWLASQEQCEDCTPEPQPDYRSAIASYRQIIDQYPEYERNDEVLFKLGDGLIRDQRQKEGIAYLHRLTQAYPEAKNLDAAYLALGEFYFSQKSTGTAQAAYQKILDNFPQSQYRNYARYKLAWTYLNLGDEEAYSQAIALFKEVVDQIDAQYTGARDAQGQIDENRLAQGSVSFRNQALNDLISTYAELPNGWQDAKTYMEEKLPHARMREKLAQLAQVLGSRGKYEEEIAVYSELMKNDSDPKYWRYSKALTLAYEYANLKQKAQQERIHGIAHVLPKSPWAEANAQSPERDMAWEYCEAELSRLAASELVAADALKNDARMLSLQNAAQYLKMYLESFGENTEAYEAHFFYAYTLDELADAALATLKQNAGKDTRAFVQNASKLLPDLRQAAAQYQKVVDLRDAHPQEQEDHTKASANRMVFVYGNILATDDPTWSLANSAKAQNFVEEKRNTATADPQPLTQAEQDFNNAVGQYATLYPTDDETPAFLWRSAEIFRARNHYNEAAQRFDAIVTHFPQHRYAAVAVGSMFELYNKAKNWEKIAYWAQWLKEKKNFKHYSASELEDATAYAIDMQAADLANAKDYDAASQKLLSIEQILPQRTDLFGPAAFKAARYLEENKAYTQALASYQHFLQLNAQSPEQRTQAQYFLAQIYAQAANYPQAFQYYQIASQDLNSPAKLYAVLATLQGVQIGLALHETQSVAAILEAYLQANTDQSLDLYTQNDTPSFGPQTDSTPLITRESASFALANALKLSDPQRAIAALDPIIAQQTPNKPQALLLKAEYALANHDLQTATSTLDALQQNASSLSTSQAAQAKYLRAEIARSAFEAVQLEFPVRTLRNRIDEKAKARLKAENLYKEAIQFKDANVSTKSALRLAQMALAFRDAFKALPIPPELEAKPDEREAYIIWLEDELIFPAEDAAASLLQYAHEITLQLNTYNEWSAASAKALAGLQSKLYPVLEASF